MINLILAVDSKGGIGRGNEIPWHIPTDLVRFKTLTTGGCVLMGRKTWDSLPTRPLTNRKHIVVSGNNKLKHPNRKDFKEEVWVCKDFTKKNLENISKKHHNLWVIGGGKIYEKVLSWGMVDKIFLTEIYNDYDCDTVIDLHKHNIYTDYIIDNYETTRFKDIRVAYTELSKIPKDSIS